MKRNITAIIVASTLVVSGCETMQQSGSGAISKEDLGTAIGASLGVLAGSQVGSGKGRVLAMVAGALAGGLIGKNVGAALDERDRQALAQETQKVLESARDGESTEWRSTHTDASATITPISTETRTQPTKIKRTAKVAKVDHLTLLNAPYESSKNAIVRSAPSTSAERVGSLPAGTTFTALGRTDNDWIAVGRRGVTVGYVYAPLVRPVSEKPSDTATDLDAMNVARQDPEQKGFDLDSLPIVSDKVVASTKCRTVKMDVRAGQQNETSEAQLCQAPDGAWEII